MTGVDFVSPPLRVFDATNVPAAKTPIPAPTPLGATQALMHVTVLAPASGDSGVVMAHDCAVTANPLTDVVLLIQPGSSVATNDVFVPVGGGGPCLTTTATSGRLVVDLKGWVTTAGAAYVDLPFSLVTTIDGPVVNAPIDLSTFGVPSDATGVAVWLDAVSSANGYASLHACDQAVPMVSDLVLSADKPTDALVAGTPISPAGLCIEIPWTASVDVSIDGYYAVGVTPTSTSPPQVRYHQERVPGFVGTSPTRLFDTRPASKPVLGGQVYRLDLSPFVPVDTTAVVMNVTVTASTASGFISVYPCDGVMPVVSSLNYGPNETVPNLVTVDAGSTLEVCFFASATTDLLADLAGYYVLGAGDGFAPSAPVRMFDTRDTKKLAAGATFDFDLSPYVATDASAVVFNLTATEVLGSGYVTAYPCGGSPPIASNLNVLAGKSVPNLVTVALPPSKHVCFFTTSATHLVADLAGWYAPSATSGFISITPVRWIDTRDDLAPVPAGSITEILFGVDFPDATAMVFNATVTEPQSDGFLNAFPCDISAPLTSNVNFVAGQTVPNMVISAVDPAGSVCVFHTAELHWIVDVSGYFTNAPLFIPFFPDGTDVS